MADREGSDDKAPPTATVVRGQRNGFLPPKFAETMSQSLRFGMWSGIGGGVFGVGFGIARDAPVFHGALNSLCYFVGGTTFSFARASLMGAMGDEARAQPRNKVAASAGAGTAAGAAMGILRSGGPSLIFPSMVTWTIIGAGGQFIANRMAASNAKPKGDEDNSWLRSKWSPLKKLTDQEYRDLMEEKKLKLDVEIALIDDHMAELRAREPAADAASPEDKGKP